MWPFRDTRGPAGSSKSLVAGERIVCDKPSVERSFQRDMKHPFFQPLGHLSGWDVIAALLGLGATLGILSLQPATWSHRFLWIGGPAMFIVARRHFFPQLSPPQVPTTPPSALRRALGFVLMIGGGLVGLFAGIIAGVCVTVGGHAWDDLLAVAASLGVFAGAVWIMILGMRAAG